MKMLNAATLPLQGRHLIEASAGTGKTYNITRLYLRLLLEKQLTVQQILVMTFTKAATEELRGRIDKELRSAVENWGELGVSDPFFAHMESLFSREQAQQILKPALLELDEAAIFTIHSFCRRALQQQAFSSGIPLEVAMEADTSELLMEAVRDWIRCINHDAARFGLLAAEGWHTPEAFYDKFRSALHSTSEVIAPVAEAMQQAFADDIGPHFNTLFFARKQQVLAELLPHKTTVFELLVLPHKQAAEREAEWEELIAWLACDDDTPCPKAAGDFINGNRYRKEELKSVLVPIFAAFKELRGDFDKQRKSYQGAFEKQLGKVPAYQLVVEGIRSVRQRFADAKKTQALMDFDDLISQLSVQIQSEHGQPLIDALRQQYPVALVDEFQDTDPLQYAIFDHLYPKGVEQHTLLMIGDPKQAIYAFRGGDIFTYLQARQGADYQWVMDTNWRSVPEVVTGYNRLFWGQPLSQEMPEDLFGYDIGYERVNHTVKAKANSTPLVDPIADRHALNYLWLPESALATVSDEEDEKGVDRESSSHKVSAADLQQAMAEHCVSEIVRLLQQARLGNEPVKEQAIAVLVRRGAEAALMRQALADAGYPSVYLSDKEDIYSSTEARELLRVLEGLLECENDALLTAALSTYLMGGTAEQLAKYRDPDHELLWEQQRQRALLLRQLWLERGCMAMLMQLIHHDYQPAPDNHERSLTNMLHLAELLQQASRRHKHPQQLLKWFKEQCQHQSASEESQLRLESDANLIRIVTMHGSKGLEYPIVFIPFASHYKDPARFGQTLYDYFEYHDVETQAQVRLVGQTDEAIRQTTAEGEAESIRLLYVAVTRAAHRCYLGVVPFKNSARSPLGLALKIKDNDEWPDKLNELSQSSDGSSQLIILDCPDNSVELDLAVQPSPLPDLPAITFSANVDDNWSLSSFSALVRNAAHVRQESKERADNDDVVLAEPTPALPRELPLRFTLRKGADAGNLLHDILEHTDFSQPHWEWSMEAPIQRFGRLDDNQHEALRDWLIECLHAELPSLVNQESFTLADLSWPQTLRESEFYFPMAKVSLSQIARCLQQHRGWSAPITLPGREVLAGMMHGFIDLIFEYQGRYYVADYKSTHLGESLADYCSDALMQNNQAHFYDLQYLIYSVALHRYLQVRLPDYEPASHIGGVYYLYLRGMSPDAPTGMPFAGVFSCRVDTSLLLQLDAVFADQELAAANEATAKPVASPSAEAMPQQGELFSFDDEGGQA
ncbi:exodeoxyribonuclease V subunit beta [Corallincola luteus]|uniref:RecBCD enzyme subunit RecB n=1 Tax=Corallincola luteus TaxID=1775177 RepID=A0ABY2AHE1_9GAMM|nr:exodeoxyribonuclease V subunit beta [Corallincola luteus]TCI02017.1 exodeoxyribonuclease V subunit beta [Corallincola luteus]